MDEVNVECKLKSIEAFKVRFEKEGSKISYDDFSKYFFVESYFFSNQIPFMEEKFYETVFELMGILFKNNLHEFEYYNNLKGGNKIMDIDCEILGKHIKKTQEFYLKSYLNYKKFHLISLNFEVNSVNVFEFLEEVFPLFIEINDYIKSLQEEMVINLEKEIEEFDAEEKKVHFESTIFN